jgi:glycosyltransferase involved in cell wall biosynthesis
MSTYNGSRYLEEQIDSILNQSLRNVQITIRDDGSTDDTVDLLKRYELRNNIEVNKGKNLGVVGSFFELIYKIDDLSQFVAFSDQDDFWHQRKLEAALEKLFKVKPGKPAMYCSRTRLVDQDLNFISLGGGISKPVGLKNAVLQNIATGCTIVLNREAIDILKIKKPNIKNIRMHDWWIYQVLSGLGEVIFDNSSYIDYRQHENNVIGSSNGMVLWVNRLKRFGERDKDEITRQLKEFLQTYNEYLSEDQIDMCREFVNMGASPNLFRRIRYAVSAPFYRQSRIDDLLFRMLLILGYR